MNDGVIMKRLSMGEGRKLRVMIATVMLIIGSGIAVYNADTLYLSGESSLTTQLPATMVPNATNTLMIMTTDGNGQPEADQRYTIELVQPDGDNETTIFTYEGRTDKNGFAAPGIAVPDFSGEAVLRVTMGDEVLSRPVSAVATSHIFLTTDKPIYQPGQVVHVRVLVLHGDHVVEGADATFEVKTPAGDKVLRKTKALNEYGVVSFDYPLSDQLPLGTYEFKVIVEGQEAVKNVKVDEYVLPRFEINLWEMKPWYTFKETVDAYAMAKYFFGKHVPGKADVKVNLFTGDNWTTLDQIAKADLDDGVIEFNYSLSNVGNQLNNFFHTVPDSVLVEFNVTVTDTGDHTEHESYVVTVAKSPIVLTALSDVNIDGQISKYYIVARYPNGAPVPDAKTVFWFDDEEDDAKSITTDSRGIAVLSWKYEEDQSRIHVRAYKDEYEGGADFDLEESTGIKVVPDKSTYQVGEPAYFNIFYAGEASTDLVYYDVVADGFTIATGHISMKGDRATLKLPVTSDFGRLTSVRVYKVEKNFNIARDAAVIGVAKTGDLDIDIDPEEEIYLPQQPVNIDIRITRDGKGVAAVLGVSIVDNAVFELGSRYTGFEEVLAGLLPQYSDPIYQFMDYIFVGNTPMPTESLSEWKKVEAAPVETTGVETGKEAVTIRNRAIGAYWTVLAAVGAVGLVALAAMGPKARRWRALAVAAMLVIVSASVVAFALAGTEPLEENVGDNFEPDWEPLQGGGWAPEAQEEGDLGPAPGIREWDDIFNTATNKNMDGQGDGAPGGYVVPTKPSIVRQFFPETWAWIPVLPTDDSGYASLELTSPDSITSWDVSVIASTKDARVGVGHQNVTVFQEFFVEPDLPAKAFLGDKFPLKVQVYNYGDPTTVTVVLSEADWFAVDGPSNIQVELDTGEVSKVEFTIELLEVGVNELTVMGVSSETGFSDQVIKPLRVKPSGERLRDLYQGRVTEGADISHVLDLHPDLIPNSENTWVKVQGGVEAAVIEGAESFIHYVSGCGEQSLSTLSIDVLAFRTVREGELDEARLLEFETIVTQGINHELQYLMEANNKKGRGIVWFPGDQDVHPWLTSWGVITFQDAIDAGFTVDPKIITDMQSWLLSQQKDDGSFVFPEWGIYEFNNPKLRSKTLATTAYVTHSLMYSGIAPDHEAVQKAVSYIKANAEKSENLDDPYVLAVSLKVLAAGGEGGSALAGRIADRLHELRTEDNGTVFWGSTTNMISNDVIDDGPEVDGWWIWDRNPGFVIETTGYAAQALYAVGRHSDDVDGAVKYLLEHRSEFGNWFSTQDTVVGFQTIYAVSERSAHVDMDVVVKVDGVEIWSEHMDLTNRDLTYLIDLRPHLEDGITVEVEGTGEGFVMYQVFLEQWLPWDDEPVYEPLELNLTFEKSELVVGDNIYVGAKVINHQDTSVKMALVELLAPVGMSFDHDEFDALLEANIVDNVEYEDDIVRLYINDVVSETPVQFHYHLRADMPAEVTLAGCRVFDMYNALIEMELAPLEITITPQS